MKKLVTLLTLLVALTAVLAACGTNTDKDVTTENNQEVTTGQGSEQGATEETNTEAEGLSKVKMIQLGTKSVMRYAELYNVADEAGFDAWYNNVFATEEYKSQLAEVSPNGTTKLLGVSVNNVEVAEVDATSFNFSVELTFEVQNVETEEASTFVEKVQATLVTTDGKEYKIQTFTTEKAE